MRILADKHSWPRSFGVLMSMLLGVLLGAGASLCSEAANQSEKPAVEILQLHEVLQGGSGWFSIQIDPEEKRLPLTLKLRQLAGTGAAAFADGREEMEIEQSGSVQIRGLIASDLSGGIELTAWMEGAREPEAVAFFDVIAAQATPRIFWGARDITDSH